MFIFKYVFNYIVNMVSKTLTITEEVYHILKEIKRKNESFSNLLRRLAMEVNGQKLDAFFGKWEMNDQEYKDIQDQINSQKIQYNADKVKFD